MKAEVFPLTYFTTKTKDELDNVLVDLQSKLSQDFPNEDAKIKKIVSLFIEEFNPHNLIYIYNLSISSKLQEAIRKTLQHAIDTELLIRHIYYILGD